MPVRAHEFTSLGWGKADSILSIHLSSQLEGGERHERGEGLQKEKQKKMFIEGDSMLVAAMYPKTLLRPLSMNRAH